MFEIGDEVWLASFDSVEKTKPCPDCCGEKHLTVILGDKSQVEIPCATCSAGYEPSVGYVVYREYTPQTELIKICGIETKIEREGLKTQYYFESCRFVDSDFVFSRREEALVKAEKLKEKHNQEEQDRFKRKESTNHTWAWNVTYHRRCIKRAEKDLEYHKSKLQVAQSHAKVEKPK